LTPLFLIHPIGGEVQYAFDLARQLDADQPVYALAASGIGIGEVPHTSIGDMAAAYLDAIRQVQASGPYMIAGWSLGGMIAYEIAHRLLAAGETVNFVGMIDTGSSAFLRAQWRAENTIDFDECRALLNWIVDLNPDVTDARQHAAYNELMALMDGKDIDAMIAVSQREALLPPQLDRALVKRMLAVYQAGARAAANYHAPSVPVTVSFFAADRQEGEDITLGWRELIGAHLDVTSIGGSHLSIVKPPYIEALARELSGRIRRHSKSAELSFA
jgi:thioesterase domain-containing protein